MVPSQGAPLFVEGSRQAVQGHGPEEAVLDVVLARPQHLHGRAHRLADLRGLRREVGVVAAAEAPAQQGRVDGDLLGRHPRDLGHDPLRPLGALAGQPRLDGVGLHVDGGVHGLHGGVAHEGQLVDGLHLAGGAAERGLGVAVAAAHLARLGDELLHLLAEGGTALGHVQPGVPLDAQGQPPLDRGPGALGHDRHSSGSERAVGTRGGDLDHVLHARHRFRLRGVEADRLAADGWAAGDDRVEHPGDAHVDAEARAAVDLGGDVDALDVGADDGQVRVLLEGQGLEVGQGPPGRVLHEVAVGEAPPPGAGDHALRGLAGGRVHLPLLGRSGHEHGAGGGARLAQGQPGVLDASTASHPVVVDRGIGGGLLDPDLRPVHVQLVGQDHGQGGHRPLSHLRLGEDEGRGAVLRDADPSVEGVGGLLFPRRLGLALGRRLASEAEGQDEGGARGAALEEGTPGEAGSCRRGPIIPRLPVPRDVGSHRAPPAWRSPAARCTARRILWYVPQRQMWLPSAPSMSPSVGRGVFASSAAAVMSMPDWQ